MQVDLSKNYNFQDIADLLASGDDSTHTQLRVSQDGKAYLSKDIGNDNLNGVALRFETWLAGNGYVGTDASNDTEFVTRIFNALQNNWPNPKSDFIDFF